MGVNGFSRASGIPPWEHLIVVVAEKPSVARAISRVLRKHGVEARVLGLRGHILDADLPEEYGWGRVDPERIFDVRRFRTIVRDERAYRELGQIFKDKEVEELVIATDNDSEGELIGSEVLELYRRFNGGDVKVSRMRFNAIADDELWRAWREREHDLNWRWVAKASYRRGFDLITGAAFTRILTTSARKVGYRGLISWGSCQTPTLNYLVSREEEIRRFKPKTYWAIRILLEREGELFWARSRRFGSRTEAEETLRKVREESEALVEDYSEKDEVSKRPKPLRTDEMLRDLNRITGMSAANILRIAEELYSEGYISYPRTDTEKWPKNFNHAAPTKAVITAGIIDEPKASPNPLQGRLDDKAHPPIYPVKPHRRDNTPRWKVWEYVARRYAANVYMPDAVLLKQRVSVLAGGVRFSADGLRILKEGYYKVYGYFRPREDPLPRLRRGEHLRIRDVKLVEEKTRPPPRLSEANLLKLMERDGIGTDATRAEYPRILIQRGYAVKSGRILKPTELGITLIQHLRRIDGRLVSPETRRMVEEHMDRIGEGKEEVEEALDKTLSIYSELYQRLKPKVKEIWMELDREVRK